MCYWCMLEYCVCAGTHRIQEVVYDASGVVVSTYAKIRVIPGIESFASDGPFTPTVFELNNRRYGILVCNDGVYPYYTGDFSEVDALKKMGADTIVWSVGSFVPIAHLSSLSAKKYKWNVIVSEDVSPVTGPDSATIIGSDGSPLASQRDVAFNGPVNCTTTGLHVRLATLPPNLI